jgi:hypothetical protein
MTNVEALEVRVAALEKTAANLERLNAPGQLETRMALLEEVAENLGRLVSDHEKRLRWNERVLFYGMGVVGLGGFVLNLYSHFRG